MRIIEVVDYDARWPRVFKEERFLLQGIIDDLSPSIHHIGSTSVEGLAAKPVIDILIEVDDLDVLDSYNPQLNAIGYIAMGEFGIPARRYFQKGGDLRSHQVHVFKRNSQHVRRHLAFRDYLRNHQDVANVYAHLKQAVAKACSNDMNIYCDGKHDFIQKYEKLALEWYIPIGIGDARRR